MKTILVILETPSLAGRAQLIGILRRINAERLDWKLRIIPSRADFSPRSIRNALRNKIDGAIVAVPQGQSVPGRLTESGFPLVVLDVAAPSAHVRSNTVFLRIDDRAIGECAARHFLDLGNFRTYAYVHDPRMEIWTIDRAKAYADTLSNVRKSCTVISPNSQIPSRARLKALVTELKALPPPIAVLAACDKVAVEVTRAATTAGLHIPDDLSILGVDNDETLCCRQRSALSSISPDFEEEGYRAVGTLLRLLRRSTPKAEELQAHVELVERGSTRPTTPAVRLVERAIAFIDANCSKPITVRDVVRHLGVSRRLADLRFRQLENESILNAITKRRLARLAELLRESDAPFKRLVRDCGFGSATRAAHLFKARMGVSMTSFRQSRL